MSNFDPVGLIFELIGKVLENPVVTWGTRILFAYICVLWVTSAFWAWKDARARMRNEFVPFLAATAMILSTPVGFPLAAFVYRLLRPSELYTERLEREYTVEALAREVEASACPGCSRPIAAEWLVCPSCRRGLRRGCPACAKPADLEWKACAWCGNALVGPEPR